ncbi:MAG: ComEA family DNA-binding protein [Acidimicrobiia bacterium]
MSRGQMTAIGLALVAVVVGVVTGSGRGSTEPGPPARSSTVDSTAAVHSLRVYVSGWVAEPGVVELSEGSIVAEAVTAAGGALSGAGLDQINLAQVVSAGDHIHVPGPADDSGRGPSDVNDGLLSINRAEATELETLPGVGPVLAEHIVSYREANGPFESADDLLDVPGIGEAKLAAIRDLITVP